MSYEVFYCEQCRTLQFEPEEVTGREVEDLEPLAGTSGRGRKMYGRCRVCQGQIRTFTRVDDLCDL